MRVHAIAKLVCIALLTACLLTASIGGLASVRAASNELIVSPVGSGDACTRADPCSFYRALLVAVDNGLDDVITLLPGIYRDEMIDLEETNSLTIRGEPGTPPTDVVINADGDVNAFRISTHSVSAKVVMRGITLEGADGSGLDISCDNATLNVELERMIVQGNSAYHDGGGIEIEAPPSKTGDGNATVNCIIRDSVIRHNQAAKRGGGIKVACGYGGSTVRFQMINTLVHGNRANWTGGGIDFSANEQGENNLVEATILNSTITDNVADADNDSDQLGGGIRARAYSGVNANVFLHLYNSIVYGNTAGSGAPQDVELAEWYGDSGRGSTVMQARHSDVGVVRLDDEKGVPEYVPLNSISADPRFRNPAGADYRLQFASPCLDRGIIETPIDYPANDLDGQPRISGPGPDVGAYEFQSASTYLPLALGG